MFLKDTKLQTERYHVLWASLVAQMVKKLPTMRET